MIKIDLPNGQVGEFPDDTPQEEITAVLRKQFGGPEALLSIGKTTQEGRPIYTNPQGDFVTERTITENIPELGGFVNIPTVYEGKFLDPKEAIDRVIQAQGKDPITGRELEVFSDVESAVGSAQERSAELIPQMQRVQEQLDIQRGIGTAKPWQPTILEQTQAGLRSFIDGLLMSNIEVPEAIAMATSKGLLTTGAEKQSFAENYREALGKRRAVSEEIAAQVPGVATGAEIAGAVLGPAKLFAAAKTLKGVAGVGAGVGALRGYGESEAAVTGDTEQLARDIAGQAAVEAMGGVAFSKLFQGLGKAGEALKNKYAAQVSKEMGPQLSTVELWKQAAKADPAKIKALEKKFAGYTQRAKEDVKSISIKKLKDTITVKPKTLTPKKVALWNKSLSSLSLSDISLIKPMAQVLWKGAKGVGAVTKLPRQTINALTAKYAKKYGAKKIYQLGKGMEFLNQRYPSKLTKYQEAFNSLPPAVGAYGKGILYLKFLETSKEFREETKELYKENGMSLLLNKKKSNNNPNNNY